MPVRVRASCYAYGQGMCRVVCYVCMLTGVCSAWCEMCCVLFVLFMLCDVCLKVISSLHPPDLATHLGRVKACVCIWGEGRAVYSMYVRYSVTRSIPELDPNLAGKRNQ